LTIPPIRCDRHMSAQISDSCRYPANISDANDALALDAKPSPLNRVHQHTGKYWNVDACRVAHPSGRQVPPPKQPIILPIYRVPKCRCHQLFCMSTPLQFELICSRVPVKDWTCNKTKLSGSIFSNKSVALVLGVRWGDQNKILFK
jgi:hypothetical protein